jgi:hypothetical protein
MAGESDSGSKQQASGNDVTLEGGNYDVIRRRLLEQAAELRAKADAANARRMQVFGSSELKLVSTQRVRTENNCLPRDMVSVGGHLLFGFQVFLGLKTEPEVSDIFAIYRFSKADADVDTSPVPIDSVGGFLTNEEFVKTFRDTFKYAKEPRLLQLRKTDTRLLMLVQIGDTVQDVRVFRFAIDASGRVSYIDARGEEDAVLPRAHDFTWTQTRREDQVAGPHPHVNILNEVFVETVGGDLTVKIENNTKDGYGIYREPVDDPNQTLDDSDIAYAKLGVIILLRIRPFREKSYRYLVFNTRTRKVVRIDAIEQACLQLPEDHGIIFPGGYYLRTGDMKRFEGSTSGLRFERMIKSPNGEDVLYVFHRPDDGLYSLLAYNLVRKEVGTPILCHGYSLFPDGTMLVFRASEQPTRVHPLQVWSTPFTSAEFAATAPTDGSYLAKVGNADLVRGISDAYTLVQLARNEEPSRQTYEDLITATTRFVDAYFWIGHEEVGNLQATVDTLRKTSELIIDEYEKLAAIRKRASEALSQAADDQKKLIASVRPEDLQGLDGFMHGLTQLRRQRGRLITLKEMREVDLSVVDALEAEVAAHFGAVSQACVGYLLQGEAFKPVVERVAGLMEAIGAATKAVELQPLSEQIDDVHEGLNLLSEVVAGLAIDDATQRTTILAGISEVFGQVNRARAAWQARKRELGSGEAKAEFAAQFALFGQSVSGALALCDSPQKCDEQMSRMLVQLEELEGRFGEYDEFVVQLAARREEVTEAFGARRQALVDERQRRAQNLFTAAERILTGVARRAKSFSTPDELNAYFASDAMIQKLGDLAEQLDKLGDSVKSEEVRSRLKSSRQDAIRALRDKTDLYEEGEAVIKLGRHRFSVNSQALELTLLPRDGKLVLHLTGTGFYDPIVDPELEAAKDLWDQALVSETPEVYRAEYLAGILLLQAEQGQGRPTMNELQEARTAGTLAQLVRNAASERYDEGYERGVHDEDAARILERLLSMRATAGLLRFAPTPRAYACLYWASLPTDARQIIHRRGKSVGRLRDRLADQDAQEKLAQELRPSIREAMTSLGVEPREMDIVMAARYLVQELAMDPVRFDTSAEAVELRDGLLAFLDEQGARRAFEDDLRALEPHPAARYALAHAYLRAYVARDPDRARFRHVMLETAAILLTERKVERDPVAAMTAVDVPEMLGQHPRINGRVLRLRLDEFLDRIGTFVAERVPRYKAYRQLRGAVVERETARLRLGEFAPKVLTSFVRNRLIDEVYLPLVGTNLAKQLGAVGEGKRTDLMGLLLLVSPPGYGKTTLMEYIASKLGLVFVKVNGPALGHGVTSIDPSEAPNATARQEVEKINFALEMGNNVMLYLDDIQHTNPELLQKFISLCDAQRRIEGVWKGQTRTYDLRGKRFCVVMAGNPYTESGAKFQIPDMLANRADTYNLGEVLEGKDDLFALSYLENALTSNTVLAPLAGRDPKDVYRLIRMAQGEEVPATDLSHAYSAAEIAEITAVLRHLFEVQSVLLKVNRQYIESASQEDAFRTEPPFKLQGSYRNMNKIAEKVVAAMNAEELQRLIDDHYQAESQTLTTGAEANLLKLAELRGRMSEAQRQRWEAIKQEFVRVKRLGGKEDDPVARVTGTISGLDAQLQGIREAIGTAVRELQKGSKKAGVFDAPVSPVASLAPMLEGIESSLKALAKTQLKVDIRQEPPPGLGDLLVQQVSLIENTLVPLVNVAMARAAAAGGDPAAATASSERMAALEARIAELIATTRMITDKLEAGIVATTPRFDVNLARDVHSNFYQPASGGTVESHGGLFIATYAKPPRHSTQVLVDVTFPTGEQCALRGTVAWAWEAGLATDPSRPVGFAVRLAPLNPKARAIIAAYLRQRPPMLVEGI